MKKSFLLLLLLTLLPLAGWAQKVDLNTRGKIELTTRDYEFTGNAVVPVVKLKDDGTSEYVSTDHYDLTYYIYDTGSGDYVLKDPAEIVNPGNYYVRAAAKVGDEIYENETAYYEVFRINRRNLKSSGFSIEYTGADKTFNGSSQTVLENEILIKYTYTKTGDTEPTVITLDETDFDIDGYENNINRGIATVKVKATTGGSHDFMEGTSEANFNILPKAEWDIADHITVGAVTYTGQPVNPTVIIYDGGSILLREEDFTATVKNNQVNAGEATLVVTPKANGNYQFAADKTVEKKFAISPRAFNTTDFEIVFTGIAAGDPAEFGYTGADVKPTVKVMDNGLGADPVEVAATNYTVDHAAPGDDFIAIGAKTVTISATDPEKNYSGALTSATYTVTAQALTANIESKSVGYGVDYSQKPTVVGVADADKADFDAHATITLIYKKGGSVISNPKDYGEYDIFYTISWSTAKAANYTLPADKDSGKKLNITKSNIFAKVGAQSLIYGQVGDITKLVHVSGLAESPATIIENFNKANFSSANWTAKKGDEVVPLSSTTVLPAGTWTVSVTDAAYESGNYNVTVTPGTWTVAPKQMDNSDRVRTGYTYNVHQVHGSSAFTTDYTGEDIVASAISTGFYYQFQNSTTHYFTDDDFEFTLPAGVKDAGTYTVTVNGKGNFQGSKDFTLTVNKAPLTITPNDGATWKIGTDPGTYTGITVTGLIGDDATKKDALEAGTYTGTDFTGAWTINRVVPATVGTHPDGIQASGLEAKNYTITWATAPLEITKGDLVLKLKPVEKEYNGTTMPSIALTEYDFAVVSGVESPETANWKELIAYSTTTGDFKALPDQKYNKGTYDVLEVKDLDDMKAKLTAASTNFTVTDIQKGTLTITPAAITLTADDQGPMKYGEFATKFKSVPSIGGSDKTVTVSVPLKAGDVITDLVSEVKLVGTLAYGTENVLTLEKKDNANYTVTIVNGKLNVTIDGTLALLGADTDYDNIVAADGKCMDVTLVIKDSQITGSAKGDKTFTWEAEQWQAMVLPFEISHKEIAKAFDFAIVNLVNPEATRGKNVMFQLLPVTGVIPANTPFCIKSVDPIADGEIINFPSRVIEKPASEYPSVPAGLAPYEDYQFVGAYKTKAVTKEESYIRFLAGGKWNKIGATSPAVFNVLPYKAFVDLGVAAAGARDVTFTFEEADGTTTAIKAIEFGKGVNAVENAEGWYTVNGMKLEGAPTQKGTYIKDGQKVIIK